MTLAAPLALLAALAALAAHAAHAGRPAELRAVPFPGLNEGRTVGCAVLRQGLTLSSEADWFGGYSDLSVEGDRALLVSDGGHRLALRLVLDADGLIDDAADADGAWLLDAEGAALNKENGDVEGLAALGAAYVVSIEGDHRLAHVEKDRLTRQTPAPPEDVAVLGRNMGYEAVTLLPDGRLLIVSEGLDADGLALVRQGQLGQPLRDWPSSRYRPAPGFNVTGARVDPGTGDLYVLERAYSLWRGPRMRIARVSADGLGEPVLAGREVTRMGWREGIDNMEGLDLARMPDGSLRLYLVSDDNFSGAQRTVLLSLSLAEGCED